MGECLELVARKKNNKVIPIELQLKLNDTSDLEARVEELEEAVVTLNIGLIAVSDEVEEVENDNALQNERLLSMEADITDNEDDINGKIMHKVK